MIKWRYVIRVVSEILPGQPEDVQVDVNSSSTILVTWDKPSANSASVKEFVVNVTMLKSFDGVKTFPDNGGNSQSVVTPHSIQVKVYNVIILYCNFVVFLMKKKKKSKFFDTLHH